MLNVSVSSLSHTSTPCEAICSNVCHLPPEPRHWHGTAGRHSSESFTCSARWSFSTCVGVIRLIVNRQCAKPTAPKGFPCCAHLPCTDMPSPLPRRNHWVHVSFVFPSDGSLPRNSAGSASALPFSRPAQRSLLVTACLLTKSHKDPLHRKLHLLRYLHRCSDC